MASTKALEDAPALPAGHVDFDALAKACAEGKSAEKAVELATKNNPLELQEEAEPTPPPVTHPDLVEKSSTAAEKE